MAITIQLPGALRGSCGGASELVASVPTVRAALDHIAGTYPSLYRCICDETGAVRRHINIWVNSAHMRDRDGLDTPLVDGDSLFLLPAVSGG